MNFRKFIGGPFFALSLFIIIGLSLFGPVFFGKISLNANSLVSFSDLYGENLPYKNISNDHLREFFPYYKFTFTSLRNFQIPFWNPYAFSGQPFVASYQTAVFYPLNILIFIFPLFTFWNFMKISPLFLGAFFTFLYLKNLRLSDNRRISSVAAFFGAATFGFGPLIVSWSEEVLVLTHAIIWLPLALFSLDRYLEEKNFKYLFLLSLSVCFSIFAGSPQVTGFVIIFIITYAFFKLRVNGIFLGQKLVFVILGVVFGFSMSAVQLLPTLELYLNSFRSQVGATSTIYETLLSPLQLLTYLAQDLFGNPATWNYFGLGIAKYYETMLFVGIAALLFAAFSLYFAKRESLIRFFAIFGLVTLSLAFDLPTTRLFFKLPIPILTSAIANRILFIPAFCLSVLTAIGLDHWLKINDKREEIVKVVRFFFGLYALVFLYFVGVAVVHIIKVKFDFALNIFPYPSGFFGMIISLKNSLLPFVVFVIISLLMVWGYSLEKHKKTLVSFAIILISLVYVFYFTNKLYSFADKRYVFPTTSDISYLLSHQEQYRSLVLPGGVFENNYATYYSLFWPEGYEGLNNKSYSEFILAAEGHSISGEASRSDVRLDKSIEALSNANVRKLLDILGVKYVIADSSYEDFLNKSDFEKVNDQKNTFHDKTYSVFENKTVMPRVFLASNYEGPPGVASTNKTEKKIKEERRQLIPSKLLSGDFDFRNVIILEEPSPISPQFGEGTADIVSYKPNEVVIKTKSGQPKLLFLTDNYYPGWKAKVDGEDTKILRADYTFKAVPLRAGEHTVRFYFDSDSFKWGLTISVLSFVIFAAFTLRKSRQKD